MTNEPPRSRDIFMIIVSRAEVDACDVSAVFGSLQSMLASPERARSMFESVDIAFHGYDDVRREIFEIDEVRAFVERLDEIFPYWLFFLTKNSSGLQTIALSLLPPFLTQRGQAKVFPPRLDALITKRWLPAMLNVCEKTGFSEEQMDRLATRSAQYFVYGPDLNGEDA